MASFIVVHNVPTRSPESRRDSALEHKISFFLFGRGRGYGIDPDYSPIFDHIAHRLCDQTFKTTPGKRAAHIIGKIMEKAQEIQILHSTDNTQVELVPMSDEDMVVVVYRKDVETPDVYYLNNMTLHATSKVQLNEKLQEEPMKFDDVEQLKNFILL